jgi:hypothetical protein
MFYSPLLAYIFHFFSHTLLFCSWTRILFQTILWDVIYHYPFLFMYVLSLDHSSSIQYLLKNSNASNLTMHFSNKTPWIPPRLFTPKKGYIVLNLVSKIFLFPSKKNWL